MKLHISAIATMMAVPAIFASPGLAATPSAASDASVSSPSDSNSLTDQARTIAQRVLNAPDQQRAISQLTFPERLLLADTLLVARKIYVPGKPVRIAVPPRAAEATGTSQLTCWKHKSVHRASTLLGIRLWSSYTSGAWCHTRAYLPRDRKIVWSGLQRRWGRTHVPTWEWVKKDGHISLHRTGDTARFAGQNHFRTTAVVTVRNAWPCQRLNVNSPAATSADGSCWANK